MKLATVALKRTVMTIALLVTASLVHGVQVPSVWAGEVVSVQLDDGKHLRAQVDERTNADRLWLRFGSGSVVILRSIEWNRITEAQHDGASIDHDTLREFASAADSDPAPAPNVFPTQPGGPTYSDRARELLDFGRRVSTVDFDAHLANWDGDVEFDGIALRLLPLDADGRVTKIRGTLNVELFASRKVRFNDAPNSRGHTTQRVGRWTVQVNPQEVSPEGVLVKLPFRTVHPEFDTSWASHGLVHARLVVPGHGVFEHSFDGVRVRPFAPLRDQRERQGEPRFLPTERTGINRVLAD
jgi:hypothetical protein